MDFYDIYLFTTATHCLNFIFKRKFSGQPSAEASKENTGKLLSSLGKSCPNMDLVEYSGAGYESYFSLKHHNEIWISQDFSCAGSV